MAHRLECLADRSGRLQAQNDAQSNTGFGVFSCVICLILCH